MLVNQPTAFVSPLIVFRLQWEKHTDAPLVPLFSRLRDEFYAIRENLRRLNQSGAEVEPPAQTVLCDAVMQTPGCWIAGVPGGAF